MDRDQTVMNRYPPEPQVESSTQSTLEDKAQDFYQLTPDQVLDALESVGFEPQAALLALNSYENRVYQFRDYDNNKFVVKFYRPDVASENSHPCGSTN